MISAHIADYTNKMGEKKLFPISGSARDERLCSKIAVKWLVLWELAMFSDRIRATIEPGPSVYRSLAMLILYENAFKMFSYFFSPAFRNGGKKQPSSLIVCIEMGTSILSVVCSLGNIMTFLTVH
jgi:hypothetical protein